MTNLIDFILDLFRNEAQAAAFVANPDGALRDAGLPNVTAAQFASVAATTAPAAISLGNGDPVVGLQKAVSSHYGFAPQPTFAPNYAPQNDLLSGNDTRLLSPETNIRDDHSMSFEFGDFTLGDKETTTATGDAVIVQGPNDGDILTGDRSVMGENNTAMTGDIVADESSKVIVGRDNEVHDSSKVAHHGDVIADNDGPVVKDVDMKGSESTTHSSSLLGIGNHTETTTGPGPSLVINDNDKTTVYGDQTKVSGTYDASTTTTTASTTSVDTSHHETSYTAVDDHSYSRVDDHSIHPNTTTTTDIDAF